MNSPMRIGFMPMSRDLRFSFLAARDGTDAPWLRLVFFLEIAAAFLNL